MAFGLALNTERTQNLQKAIENELIRRDWYPEGDAVMAEYITIMLINNKTESQVSGELQDLIGTDVFEDSFTSWLFAEAAKGAPDEAPAAEPQASSSSPAPAAAAVIATQRDTPPHTNARGPPSGPRSAFGQAINQAVPSSSQKRTVSARSPSPSTHGPNKARRTDGPPTGPRAMHGQQQQNGRLIDRIQRGPPPQGRGPPYGRDEVQARIDNITHGPGSPDMMMNGMPPGMMGGFPPGMGPMDMQSAMMNMTPMFMEQMLMNQAAILTHLQQGQMPPGFNNNGSMGMNGNGFGGHQQGGPGRGRGAIRGGRGGGRGGGPATGGPPPNQQGGSGAIAAPTPTPAASAPSTLTPTAAPFTPAAPKVNIPERPASPTICKFGVKCTNALCRWTHPSPVATPESGVVLSLEACENGKGCKDADCTKAHVSPAVNNPAAVEAAARTAPKPATPAAASPHPQHTASIPCRFGAGCTRPNCAYKHPPGHALSNGGAAGGTNFAQPCRFGSACTRATCPFQHPADRVLPGTFHRGLEGGQVVNVKTPEAGSMGVPNTSHNKSVTFNGGDLKEKLQARMAEIEEQKRKVKEAEEARAKAASAKAA